MRVADLVRSMLVALVVLLASWGLLVVAASESGKQSDVRVATDALCDALDVEGWLSADPADA